MSFHSTHATSQALHPMQVVVSTNLQTSRSRCIPRPGEGVEWPEISSVCSALRSAIPSPPLSQKGAPSKLCLGGSPLHFFDLDQKPLELRRKRVRINHRRSQLIRQCLRCFAFILGNA